MPLSTAEHFTCIFTQHAPEITSLWSTLYLRGICAICSLPYCQSNCIASSALMTKHFCYVPTPVNYRFTLRWKKNLSDISMTLGWLLFTTFIITYCSFLFPYTFSYFSYNGLRGLSQKLQLPKLMLWNSNFRWARGFSQAFLAPACPVLAGLHKVNAQNYAHACLRTGFSSSLWFFSSTEFHKVIMGTADNYDSNGKCHRLEQNTGG